MDITSEMFHKMDDVGKGKEGKTKLIKSKKSKRRIKSVKTCQIIPEEEENVEEPMDVRPVDITNDDIACSSDRGVVDPSPIPVNILNTDLERETETVSFGTEINFNGIQNNLPVENAPLINSNNLAVTEGSGDSERLGDSQMAETSNELVAKEGQRHDREDVYVLYQSLAKELQEVKTQNKIIMSNHDKLINIHKVQGNNEDTYNRVLVLIEGITEQIYGSMKNVHSEIMTQVNERIKEINLWVNATVNQSCKDVIQRMERIQEKLTTSLGNTLKVIQIEVEKVNKGLQKEENIQQYDFLSLENRLDLKVKEMLLEVKNELLQNLRDERVELSRDIGDWPMLQQIKSELESAIGEVKSGLECEIGVIKGDLCKEREWVKDLVRVQSESFKSYVSEILSAIIDMQAIARADRNKVNKLQYDVEVLQGDVTQIMYDSYEEIETRHKEIEKVNNRLDLLENEYKSSKERIQEAEIKNNPEILVLQSQNHNFTSLLLNCNDKIKKLEGLIVVNKHQVEALSVKWNALDVQVETLSKLNKEVLEKTAKVVANDRSDLLMPPILSNVQKVPIPCPTKAYTLQESERATSEVKIVTKVENVRYDKVITDILSREQRPSFTGDNMSPQRFLQEVEAFHDLFNVTTDQDKLKLFPLFLKNNPLEWWKLIYNNINTWQLAKESLLQQYFTELDRTKYKNEWKNICYKEFSSAEEFALKAIQLLNIIKPKESEQKKCERVAVKMPDSLRDYLIDRPIVGIQEFMYRIKEAMLLKSFDSSLHFNTTHYNSYTDMNASSGNYNTINDNNNCSPPNTSRRSLNNNNSDGINNNNNNNSNSGNTGYVWINPRYKGDPKNYIPNFRYSYRADGYYQTRGNNNYGYQTPPRSPSRSQNQINNNRGSNIGYWDPNNNITGQRGLANNSWIQPSLGISQATIATSDSNSQTKKPTSNFYFHFNEEFLKKQALTQTATVPKVPVTN